MPPLKDYFRFKIKVYTYWDLFLHENQFPYIGRCYAWVRKENVTNLEEMSKSEMFALFDVIIPEYSEAIRKLFPFDKLNLAIFGNEAPHLHAHFIPRRNNPIKVYDIEFTDPNPNGNYSPYNREFEIPDQTLMQIKIDITKYLVKNPSL